MLGPGLFRAMATLFKPWKFPFRKQICLKRVPYGKNKKVTTGKKEKERERCGTCSVSLNQCTGCQRLFTEG